MKSFYSKRVIKLLLYDQQRGKCKICVGRFPIGKMEMDHIIARAGGGSDIPSNFQLLCKPCNVRKHAKIARGAQYNLFDSPKQYAPRQDGNLSANTLKKRRQRHKAAKAGLCKRCTQQPPKPGLKHCSACLTDIADYNRERLARKK